MYLNGEMENEREREQASKVKKVSKKQSKTKDSNYKTHMKMTSDRL